MARRTLRPAGTATADASRRPAVVGRGVALAPVTATPCGCGAASCLSAPATTGDPTSAPTGRAQVDIRFLKGRPDLTNVAQRGSVM